MSKLSFICVAIVAVYAGLAMPAVAQQKSDEAGKLYAERDVCGSRSAGNPYSQQTDYWDWSAWRGRGGWDARNDYRCPPRREAR
jgi:hypothetical protein